LLQESSATLAQIQEGWVLDQTDLRRAVLSRSRAQGIPDREVIKALSASRIKADTPGDPADIPLRWRDCEVIGYIAPISNIPSILSRGILCHEEVGDITHDSVADVEVQGRRANRDVQLFDGRSIALHKYVNLYINPRNAMMYRVRSNDVVVVLVDAQRTFVLPGAHVVPRNAAAGRLEAFRLPHGLREIDPDVVYSTTWRTPNGSDPTLKQAIQAEVLVPSRVSPELIKAIGVRNDEQRQRLSRQVTTAEVLITPVLFFD
jgi:hypothetical protein